jgi:ribosomal silencing factor RsfS
MQVLNIEKTSAVCGGSANLLDLYNSMKGISANEWNILDYAQVMIETAPNAETRAQRLEDWHQAYRAFNQD